MKKGLITVTLGIGVTIAGLVVDTNQSKEKKFKSRDYANMAGALLVGAGITHIALGSIDMLKN